MSMKENPGLLDLMDLELKGSYAGVSALCGGDDLLLSYATNVYLKVGRCSRG